MGKKKYLKDKTFYKSADFKEKVLFLVLRFLWDILYKNEHISLTREYLENNGIKLTAAKYDQIAFLDIETGGKYSAYDILRLLKILGLL